MKSSQFWKAVLVDRDNFLESFLDFMRDSGIRYCLIGGAAVNGYADPVVTQDLDIVVAASDLSGLEESLVRRFKVTRFAHSLNITSSGSKLQVQIQMDSRYFDFVDRAVIRDVMDYNLPVACIEDLLQGKIWAALDKTRLPSKQLKDLSDIARLIEVDPALSARVPSEILSKIPGQTQS